MAGVIKRSFDSPDERLTPEKAQLDLIDLGSAKAGRGTLEPGWRWSECIKPIAGTVNCQARHVGVVASGYLRIEHEDGSAADLGPGDVYVIEPGHDAWVVGDEPYVAYEFEAKTVATYGRPPS
jgi:hypothetical protein